MDILEQRLNALTDAEHAYVIDTYYDYGEGEEPPTRESAQASLIDNLHDMDKYSAMDSIAAIMGRIIDAHKQ